MTDRGVSSPLGVILLLGITIAAVTALVVTGGAVIDETRADAEQSQTENAMAQFSSKASLVGLGQSGDQRFSLGRVSEGDVRVEEAAGNVSVYVNQTNGNRLYISNVSMGAVIYRSGDTEIAYQGGGVWDRTNGFTKMISPPEYHYQAATLTFPIINVTGDDVATGEISGRVTADKKSRGLYPNVTKNEAFVNPLENGTVYVEIESQYCGGWETFIQDRSKGSLKQECDQGETNTIIVDLSADLNPAFGEAVIAGTVESNNADVDSVSDGVVAPSADGLIEERINDCANCTKRFSGELKNGTHYTENASDFQDLELNTTQGDVDVIINDSVGGIDGTGSIDVTGNGNATVYLKTNDDMNVGGGDTLNGNGSPEQLLMYVHADVSAIKISGSFKYVGGIYAPETSMKGDQGDGVGCGGGNVTITGSVIVQNFCFKNGEFNHGAGLENVELDIDLDTVKYLHVSESRVEVEFE